MTSSFLVQNKNWIVLKGDAFIVLSATTFKPLQPPFLPAQLTCPNSLLKRDLPLTEVQAHQENGKFYALLLILHNLHYYHQIEQENKCWHILSKQPLKIETSSHKR